MAKAILAGLVVALLTVAGAGVANAADVFVIHHKVADYAKWRPFFDGDKANQQAAGLTNPRVYRSLASANDITIVFDMADAAKAKSFTASKALKATMTKAGVVGKPTFAFLESAP